MEKWNWMKGFCKVNVTSMLTCDLFAFFSCHLWKSNPIVNLHNFLRPFMCRIKWNCVQQIFSPIEPPTNWINDKLPNKLHFLYDINIIHPCHSHTYRTTLLSLLLLKKNNFLLCYLARTPFEHFLYRTFILLFRLLLYLLINCY